MATRAVAVAIAEQPRRQGGRKLKNGQGHRKMRALGDIGNLVILPAAVDGKLQRPITRSLCAQLMANAQEVVNGIPTKINSAKEAGCYQVGNEEL